MEWVNDIYSVTSFKSIFGWKVFSVYNEPSVVERMGTVEDTIVVR